MRLRRATSGDTEALLAIDGACFPPGFADRQLIQPGEIEAGVTAHHVIVAEDRTGLLGFIQIDVPSDDHLYIVAIEVRPDTQRRRVGSKLLNHVLESVNGEDLTVSSISGTQNLGMLRLLLGHGFVVSAVMRDYHGPGNDRFYCQYRKHNGFSDRENVYLIPFTNARSVYDMLDSPEYVITAIVGSASSGLAMFEVSRVEIGERSTMQASESTVGIIFSAAMLVVVMMVFNLVMSNGIEPMAFMMLVAVLASIGSLVVRVSVSGDSIRLGTGSFEHHMVWGGVLSEYGGVLPVVVVLPVLVGLGSTSEAAAIILGSGTSIALISYEFSRFSIQSRYSGWIAMWLLAVLTSLLPLIGVLLPYRSHDAYELWAWVCGATAILVIRAVIMGRTAVRTLTVIPAGVGQTRA